MLLCGLERLDLAQLRFRATERVASGGSSCPPRAFDDAFGQNRWVGLKGDDNATNDGTFGQLAKDFAIGAIEECGMNDTLNPARRQVSVASASRAYVR